MTDKELRTAAKQFTKGLLGGRPSTDMCFIVCSPLAAYLSACKIDCTLTEGEVHGLHHFWITLSDGRIIDPTADQFSFLNIWVRKQPSYYQMYTEEESVFAKKWKTNDSLKGDWVNVENPYSKSKKKR